MIRRLRRFLRNELNYLRGLGYSHRKRVKNQQKPAIKLYFYRDEEDRFRNFGDEFSVDLIHNLFGYSCVRTLVNDCELVATGSNINWMNDNQVAHKKVWGSGLIAPIDLSLS